MTNRASVPEPAPISREVFESRLAQLLRPRHGSRPWPKRRLDRWILLYCVARTLRDGEELAERDASARIQNWLLGPGAGLVTDFVTLRRALIDEGFWDREDGGSRYRLATRHRRRVRFDAGLPDATDVLSRVGSSQSGRGPRAAPGAP